MGNHTRVEPWRRFLPWRGRIELLAWVLAFLIPAIANTAVELVDAQRHGRVVPAWHPAVWEASSALVSLLLVPFLLAACERWPLHADTWRRRLPGYLLGSVAWSVLHVIGMMTLRKLAYLAIGDHYDPGAWLGVFEYEYLKDVRTFSLIVMIHHGYRWFWRRLQGEVRLLDPPEDMPAPVAGERPERFLVRKLGREFLVSVDELEWLQAAGNYVNLRVRGHDYPLRSTMATIEAQLDPARFARIHRSHIVNLDLVASIEPLDTGDARVHLRDGTVLPCSRRQRELLRERLVPAAPRNPGLVESTALRDKIPAA
jgi:hypothetical protein